MSSLALYIGTLKASQFLHDLLLRNVVRAPTTTFYDVTPVGRVLNRFSKDVDTLDSILPMTIRGWTMCFFSVFALICFCLFYYNYFCFIKFLILFIN